MLIAACSNYLLADTPETQYNPTEVTVMPQQDTLSQSKQLQKDGAFTAEQADLIAIALFRATEHLPTKMQMDVRFSSLEQNINDLKQDIKDLKQDMKDIPRTLLIPITLLVVLASAVQLFI